VETYLLIPVFSAAVQVTPRRLQVHVDLVCFVLLAGHDVGGEGPVEGRGS